MAKNTDSTTSSSSSSATSRKQKLKRGQLFKMELETPASPASSADMAIANTTQNSTEPVAISETAPTEINNRIVVELDECKSRCADLLEERNQLKEKISEVETKLASIHTSEELEKKVAELEEEMEDNQREALLKYSLVVTENNQLKELNNTLVKRMAEMQLNNRNLQRQVSTMTRSEKYESWN